MNKYENIKYPVYWNIRDRAHDAQVWANISERIGFRVGWNLQNQISMIMDNIALLEEQLRKEINVKK